MVVSRCWLVGGLGRGFYLYPVPRSLRQWLEVWLGGRRVVFVSIYFPGSSNPVVLAQFRTDIRLLLSLGSDVIIGGDFNCRHGFWGCQRSNAAGKVLFQKVISSDCLDEDVFPDSPTHFPDSGRTPSTLDFMLVRGQFHPQDVHVEDCLDSDHLPVFSHLAVEPTTGSVPGTWVKDYSRVD